MSTTTASPTTINSDQLATQIAEGLGRLLADTYSIYLKTQNYHWNVRGPLFHTLHAMFEEQYTELAIAIDEIAERIRALGFPSPGSFSEFTRLSNINEPSGSPTAQQMVADLIADQATLVATAKDVFPLVESNNDEPTADLLIRRMQVHEKTAWMLKSLTE